MEVGEPQRRLFTAIGTVDESYSIQMKGTPAQGQLAVYDATLARWVPQSGSINSTIKVETAFESASVVDQNPTGLGVALQVTFGGALNTPYFSDDGLGNITCLASDEYTIRIRVGIGRENSETEAKIYLRALINGVSTPYTAVAIIDNSRIEIPATFESTVPLQANDVLTFEVIRDTDGDNSGGLRAGTPVVNWNSSPSALLIITRFAAVSP
jgi:hypothetical protein